MTDQIHAVFMPKVHLSRPKYAPGHAVGDCGAVLISTRGAAGEFFTLAEARDLCVAGDAALLTEWGSSWAQAQVVGVALSTLAPLALDDVNVLIVRRDWLVAFLAAVRRALRAADAAPRMAAAR